MRNSRSLYCQFGSLQRVGVAAVIVASMFLDFGTAPMSKAAPITLAFDATVYSSHPRNPNSVLEIDVGDTIYGQITFEPVTAEPGSFGGPAEIFDTTQPYSASLLVNGHQLRTSLSRGETFFRVVNENSVVDLPGIRLFDEVEVFSLIEPVNSSNPDLDLSTFRMSLWGNVSTIDTPELPAEVDVWNSFDSFLDPLRPQFNFTRSLDLSLGGESGGRFSALIGDFVVVPEPTSGLGSIVLLAFVACCRKGNSENLSHRSIEMTGTSRA